MGQYKYKTKTGKKRWLSRFEIDKQPYKKEGFLTKSEATEWEVAKRHRFKHPKTEALKQPLLFSKVAVDYINTYSKDYHQKNTYGQKLFVFETFLKYQGTINPDSDELPIEEITPPIITKYIKARKDANNFACIDEGDLSEDQEEYLEQYSFLVKRKGSDGNKCANRDLKEFKALFTWANRQAIILYNPVINIEPYPEENKPTYIPPLEDINKVLLVATDW